MTFSGAKTARTARDVPDGRSSLCIRLRWLELLAVASSTPLAVLRAPQEMCLLALKATAGACPSLAVFAAYTRLVGIGIHGLDRCELAVGVRVGRTRHRLLAALQNATNSPTRDSVDD